MRLRSGPCAAGPGRATGTLGPASECRQRGTRIPRVKGVADKGGREKRSPLRVLRRLDKLGGTRRGRGQGQPGWRRSQQNLRDRRQVRGGVQGKPAAEKGGRSGGILLWFFRTSGPFGRRRESLFHPSGDGNLREAGPRQGRPAARPPTHGPMFSNRDRRPETSTSACEGHVPRSPGEAVGR